MSHITSPKVLLPPFSPSFLLPRRFSTFQHGSVSGILIRKLYINLKIYEFYSWRRHGFSSVLSRLPTSCGQFSSIPNLSACSESCLANTSAWKLHRNARIVSHLSCATCSEIGSNGAPRISCVRSGVLPISLHLPRVWPPGNFSDPQRRHSLGVNCLPEDIISGRLCPELNSEVSSGENKLAHEREKLAAVASVVEQLQTENAYVSPPLSERNPYSSTPVNLNQQVGDVKDASVNVLRDESRRESQLEREAWDLLKAAVVHYCGSPVGTIAANDPMDPTPLNYDQVFIRDFVPSAIAFLLKGESEIVRNFLLHTLQLQSWEKTVDCYSPGQGLMPASFKVRVVPRDGDDMNATEEILDPDFGEAAIGRVAPVDSGLWWIILLRAYSRCTGDFSVQERVDVQTGIKMILKLCLADGFDMFPTLLVTDGSCMIDRRMGIHGHPLEIQALFYSALRCAREMITLEDGSVDLLRAVNNRLIALSFHIREYYWVDLKKINEIYRYKTEEYSYDAVNKFNIYPDQISPWLVEWMPDQGGYLIGNLQPAHMDFRFFSLGNLWAIVGSLATPEQSNAILDLIEAKWSDLMGNMPLKICYPALECEEWRIITGSDPKNTPWSYHNGGSWPTLLWQLAVACMKMRRPDIVRRAIEVAEMRISKDRWPEYYDTRTGKFVGKQARLYQTWSIAGYLVAKLLLNKPEAAQILTCEEDVTLLEACTFLLEANPKKKRGRKPKKPFLV